MRLPKGSLITLVANPDFVNPGPEIELTEHNRSAFDEDIERMGSKKRMANARMRMVITADKKTWSVSWKDLPATDESVIDKKSSVNAMDEFYREYPGEVLLKIHLGYGGPDLEYRVHIESFSKVLNKRGKYAFYDVSMKLEEL